MKSKTCLCWKSEAGSLTLEATILLPFFLAFILALAGFIAAAKAEIAVQAAASETVKQLAHHYAPLEYLRKGLVAEGEARLQDIWEGMPPFLSQGMRELIHYSEELAAERIIEPVLHYYAADHLQQERLTVQSVSLPKVDDPQESYFTIEVLYEWSYPVPFLQVEKAIHKKAVERVWK